MADRRVDAVTFDYWNTLVGEDPRVFEYRRQRVRELVGDRVLGLTAERVNAAFEEGWRAYVEAWHRNHRFGAADAVPLMLQALGVDKAESKLVDTLVDVIEHPLDTHKPPLTVNIADTLATLKDADIRLGIICDVGLTPSRELRRWLDQHGVLTLFDHWSFSDEVGEFKPSATIFRHALDGLGAVPPERAAHVGDLRRTDIAGAKAMGIMAIRYCGVADDPPAGDGPIVEGDHVIADHAELPAVLDID
jgi:putative hydrolase of the HAD superfamily